MWSEIIVNTLAILPYIYLEIATLTCWTPASLMVNYSECSGVQVVAQIRNLLSRVSGSNIMLSGYLGNLS
jgi:hypothetical protein